MRGVIPDDLITRKKQGFGAPVHEWYMNRLGDIARKELTSFCNKSGLLNKGAVDAILASGRGAKVWYLLNLALWWEEYIA